MLKTRSCTYGLPECRKSCPCIQKGSPPHRASTRNGAGPPLAPVLLILRAVSDTGGSAMSLLKVRRSASLGEVVAAAYAEATRVTSDRERAARLTAAAVKRFLVATGNVRVARRLAEAA